MAHADVEAYIDSYPDDVQQILRKIRSLLSAAVPDSGEKISYQIPTVTMAGESLLYYAGWKRHIGMYPVARGDADFERRLEPHRAEKDSVRFVYSEPIPYDLILEIAEFTVMRRLAE